MNETDLRILSSCLAESTTELFESYGTVLIPGDIRERELAAMIGIAANDFAGAVILVSTQSSLAELAKNVQATHHRDWLAELANQLVGRLKRRLTVHGLVFSMGTPVVISGSELRLSSPTETRESVSLGFRATEGAVAIEVRLDAEFQHGFCLQETPEADLSLPEGEALLF